jgi:hypothetical protein
VGGRATEVGDGPHHVLIQARGEVAGGLHELFAVRLGDTSAGGMVDARALSALRCQSRRRHSDACLGRPVHLVVRSKNRPVRRSASRRAILTREVNAYFCV